MEYSRIFQHWQRGAYLFAYWCICMVLSSAFFSKSTFLKFFSQEYHQSVKQHGSIPDPIFSKRGRSMVSALASGARGLRFNG